MRYFYWLIFPLFAGCASFAPPPHSANEFAPQAATAGPVAEFANAATASTVAGESAFWLLETSRDALEARAVVIDNASARLDVQYFIWQGDVTAQMLMLDLIEAADRGVRVRLLVDDLSASGRDREFLALTQHDNIEVRSFNVFRARNALTQALEFIFKSRRLNHRMHNKTLIADGRLAMIGGRNIGDRYFGVYDEFIQDDLDIMFAGDIVQDAERGFDAFWNSPLAVTTDGFIKPRRRTTIELSQLRSELAQQLRDEAARISGFAVDWLNWRDRYEVSAYVGAAELYSIRPETDVGAAERIKDGLYEYLASAQEEIVIVSAYFIPDDALIGLLEDARRRGVRVVLLTNSVQSNNHMLAHVAYRPSRRRVLRAGIELFEMRPDTARLARQTVQPVQPGYLGLHSKAFVVDGRYAMVGTANLDPRALDINMESAVIVDDEDLAAELRTLILSSTTPDNAWQMSLDRRGRLVWTSDQGQLTREPVRGPWQRFKQFIHTLLPIRGQA